MKILLKFSLLTIAFVAISLGSHAQTERSEDFNESWNGIDKASVDHRHGTLEVIPHGSSEVRLDAHILVQAKEEADAQILIDHFEILSNTSNGQLNIETKFNTKSWTTTNNNTKIRFSDGTKIAGIKKIEIKYKLYVPSLESLALSNKYNDIEITEDYSGDLTVKLYDATLRSKNVSGVLDLTLKYGKAYTGSSGDLILDIYDSKVEISGAHNVTMKSKYSYIKLGKINSAQIDFYDGLCKIESVTESLKITDKYSAFEIGSAGEADVTMYDGKMKLDRTAKYNGVSKYTAYDFEEIGTINLKSTHDDRFNFQKLGSLNCDESKYTNYEIETLTEKAIIKSSYDDELLVSNVSSTFNHFEIDCKYTTVNLPLTALPGYLINAKMKYGKLSYAEPTENIVHKEYNEQLELRAQVGDKASDVNVIINGYDSDIRLK